MEINKLDILTIFILSIIFFSIATLNLGSTEVPLNSWKTNGNTDFFIDLGKIERVGTVYFLIKNSSETQIQVYTGSPGNWNFGGTIDIQIYYYSWTEGLALDVESQYIGFNVSSGFIEIAELAVLDSSNQKMAINSVGSENSSNVNFSYLIDEQTLVQLPNTYMGETFFDEIYFVRTAENYLKNQHPFEWTHPPLGKLIIASGIAIFGFNPFGWRIMGVIFATLMIPLIYFIGKELFQTWIGGFSAAFLLTFDFMHFTLARMATVDTYVIFFSIASQLFFLVYLKKILNHGWKNTSTKPLFFAILFFALGFSTKWIAIYGFAAQIVILFAIRLKEVLKLKDLNLSDKINAFLEHPYAKILEFLLIAVLVYFLTYIPDIITGRTILDVFSLQGGMYNYHSTLIATHAFSSAWWSWPLILKPVWLYVSYLPLNVKSTIVLLGNPAVWWVGFSLIIAVTERAWRKKSFECAFIIAFFFIHWIPYMLISRIKFLYQFYINVPLLCLASAYFLSKYWSTKWGKILSIFYFSIVVILFGYFHAVISGTPAPISWIDSLKWLPGWAF
jgi:dolichyl-phosphate-mannose--protein O-mannosyl transferase